MSPLADPRIPDAAFQAVADRADVLHDVTMGTASSPEEAAEAAHVYARSVGLEHEGDPRAYRLAQSALVYLAQASPDHIVTDNEVHAAVAGIGLGLALARETGWEPPIPDTPTEHPLTRRTAGQ